MSPSTILLFCFQAVLLMNLGSSAVIGPLGTGLGSAIGYGPYGYANEFAGGCGCGNNIGAFGYGYNGLGYGYNGLGYGAGYNGLGYGGLFGNYGYGI